MARREDEDNKGHKGIDRNINFSFYQESSNIHKEDEAIQESDLVFSRTNSCNESKEDENTNTYEKIVDFFQEHKSLTFGNFNNFLEYTQLNSVIYYKDLVDLWEKFKVFCGEGNIGESSDEFTFNDVIDILEKLIEHYSEMKDGRVDDIKKHLYFETMDLGEEEDKEGDKGEDIHKDKDKKMDKEGDIVEATTFFSKHNLNNKLERRSKHRKTVSDYIGNFKADNAASIYTLIKLLDFKSKNYVNISEVRRLIDQQCLRVSKEDVIDFLLKISLAHNNEQIYVNIDMLRRAIHRLEQHLEFKTLENKQSSRDEPNIDTHTVDSLFEELASIEGKNDEVFLVVKSLCKELEFIFDELVNHYNKILSYDNLVIGNLAESENGSHYDKSSKNKLDLLSPNTLDSVGYLEGKECNHGYGGHGYSSSNKHSPFRSKITEKDYNTSHKDLTFGKAIDCIDTIKFGIEDIKIKIKDIELYNKKLEDNYFLKISKFTMLKEKVQAMDRNLKFFNDYYETMETNRNEAIISKLISDNEKLREELGNIEKNFDETEKNLKDKTRENLEIKDRLDAVILELDKLRKKSKENERSYEECEKQMNKDYNIDEEIPSPSKKKKNIVSSSSQAIIDPIRNLKRQFSLTSKFDFQVEYQKLLIQNNEVEKENEALEEKFRSLSLLVQNQTKRLFEQNNEIRNLKKQLIELENINPYVAEIKTNNDNTWSNRFKNAPFTPENHDCENENETSKQLHVESLENCLGDEEDFFSDMGKNYCNTDTGYNKDAYSSFKISKLDSDELMVLRKSDKLVTYENTEDFKRSLPDDAINSDHRKQSSTLPNSSEFTLLALPSIIGQQKVELAIENNIQNTISQIKNLKEEVKQKDRKESKDRKDSKEGLASKDSKEKRKESTKSINAKTNIANNFYKLETQKNLEISILNIASNDNQATSMKRKSKKDLPPVNVKETTRKISTNEEEEFELKASVTRQRLLTQISDYKRRSNRTLIKVNKITTADSDEKATTNNKNHINPFGTFAEGDTSNKEQFKFSTPLKHDPVSSDIENNPLRNPSLFTIGTLIRESVVNINSQNDSYAEKDYKTNLNFLNFKSPAIYKIITKLEPGNKSYIFADNVFLFESNQKTKDYFDLVITNKHALILNSEKSVLKASYKLENLFKISVSLKNLNLLILHFNQGDDLAVYTFRRNTAMNFLKYNYLKPNKKTIKFEISDCIKYQLRNSIKDFVITQVEVGLDPSSYKIGYLKKYCIKVLKNVFIEKFASLCNFGLIYFDIGDNTPKRLIPLVGCSILKVSANKYKQPYCFEIKGGEGNELFVFSARSQEEADDWILTLNRFKDKQENCEGDFIRHYAKFD